MRRVLVIGSGSAGKSTFASTLSRRTGLPLIHLRKMTVTAFIELAFTA
jgi:adenylate kinase family enzyme